MVIVVLQWLVRFVVPVVVPEAMPFGVIGGLVGELAVIVWWLFFSRAPWSDGVMPPDVVAGLATASAVLHGGFHTRYPGAVNSKLCYKEKWLRRLRIRTDL